MIDNLFIFDAKQVPENFLELSIITTYVNDTYAFNDCPFFFKVENTTRYYNTRNPYKLCIYQTLKKSIVTEYVHSLMSITNYPFDICHKILYKSNFDLEETIDFLVTYDKERIDDICSQVDLSSIDNNVKLASFYNHYSYTKSIISLLRENYCRSKFLFYITHKNIRDCEKFTMFIHVYIDKIYLNSIYESPRVPSLLINLIKYESIKKNLPLVIPEVESLKENKKLNQVYKREYYNYQQG